MFPEETEYNITENVFPSGSLFNDLSRIRFQSVSKVVFQTKKSLNFCIKRTFYAITATNLYVFYCKEASTTLLFQQFYSNIKRILLVFRLLCGILGANDFFLSNGIFFFPSLNCIPSIPRMKRCSNDFSANGFVLC